MKRWRRRRRVLNWGFASLLLLVEYSRDQVLNPSHHDSSSKKFCQMQDKIILNLIEWTEKERWRRRKMYGDTIWIPSNPVCKDMKTDLMIRDGMAITLLMGWNHLSNDLQHQQEEDGLMSIISLMWVTDLLLACLIAGIIIFLFHLIFYFLFPEFRIQEWIQQSDWREDENPFPFLFGWIPQNGFGGRR